MKKIFLTSTILASIVVLSSCNFTGGEKEDVMKLEGMMPKEDNKTIDAMMKKTDDPSREKESNDAMMKQ